MALELLINQRLSLSKVLAKGISNDGSVPSIYRGGSEIVNALNTKKKGANDGSEVSGIKTYEERENDFSNFTIYVDKADYDFGYYGNLNTDVISLTPIVKYARKKTIITTPVNQIDEVIEQWGMTGYEISVHGLLVDVVKHQYPQKQIQKLRELFEKPKTAVVSGELFHDLGITDIYILEFSVEPLQGFPDTAHFSFQAKSIHPYSFTLEP